MAKKIIFKLAIFGVLAGCVTSQTEFGEEPGAFLETSAGCDDRCLELRRSIQAIEQTKLNTILFSASVGGAFGAAVDEDNRLRGAAVGAIVGGIIGTAAAQNTAQRQKNAILLKNETKKAAKSVDVATRSLKLLSNRRIQEVQQAQTGNQESIEQFRVELNASRSSATKLSKSITQTQEFLTTYRSEDGSSAAVRELALSLRGLRTSESRFLKELSLQEQQFIRIAASLGCVSESSQEGEDNDEAETRSLLPRPLPSCR